LFKNPEKVDMKKQAHAMRHFEKNGACDAPLRKKRRMQCATTKKQAHAMRHYATQARH